jgi:hypothetical protein
MAGESAHVFFAASAGVAGALIGLLFVALSVAPERILGAGAEEVHAVRAAATLTAFTNALSVSLFALVPGLNPGGAAVVVASLGLIFVTAAVVRLAPLVRSGEMRLLELRYLAGLCAVFVLQLIAGLHLEGHPGAKGSLQTLCILVAVCFLIGIARAWDLVGGPRVGLLDSIARRREPPADSDPPQQDSP